MQEYHKRIAKTAVRCSGQPVTLSPLVFHDPTNIKSVAGNDVDFRVVLFMGCIDSDDLTITFPEDTVVKVHVKHDVKAIDMESERRKRQGYSGKRSTTAVVCSRDCATYYRLPKGVEKSNLTAQLTQDGFLIIQSRKERSTVFGFESKRLVPLKGCLNLNPCLSARDLSNEATELMEVSYKLWQRVKEIQSQVAVEDLDSSFGSEPGMDAFTGNVGFQYSSRSAFVPASTTHSEGDRRDAGSTGQGGSAEETNRRMATSTKSAEEICEEKAISATESEADEVEIGSTSESDSEAAERSADSSVPVDVTEVTSKRKPRSAKSTVEEIGKEKTGSSQSKAVKKNAGCTVQSEVAGDVTSCSAHDEVAEEATKRKTRSAKSATEGTSKKEIGSVRSGQSSATEPTVDQETDSETPPKRITRSKLKTDETDKKQVDDLKSIAGNDGKETDSSSQSAEGGDQETAGSDSKAEESGSKQSEVPRRVRSKERPKETSGISKLKEESKRRKSAV